jgi:hypothetical protein
VSPGFFCTRFELWPNVAYWLLAKKKEIDGKNRARRMSAQHAKESFSATTNTIQNRA